MSEISILAVELPEEIMKAKWAGDYEWAIKLIDARIHGDCTEALKERLLLEKERLERLPRQYTLSSREALAEMQRLVPGFTQEELDALDLEGATDYLYRKGEKMYFYDFPYTLLKMKPELSARAGQPQRNGGMVDQWIEELSEAGVSGRRMRMRSELRVTDDAFEKGQTYIVHLPIPARAAQTTEIRLEGYSHSPVKIAGEDAGQRTICFRETLEQNETFWVEYSYVSTLRYFDGDHPPKPEVFYPGEPAPREADLAELEPHIRFSPYLRKLAEELKGEETDKLAIARRIYDYITNHVRYSYVRAYLQLDDIADYGALSLKGDCGVQALMFMALCRICGIPARWQSGLYAEPGDEGCHDWAQFYIAQYGWLFADCSFGGAGRRRGNEKRRRFYFGNLDPYRMVANREYQADFDPPKKWLRKDPFDNQKGECETPDRALRSHEISSNMKVLECEQI